MTTKRQYHALVTANGNLYALGGSYYPGVERAAINIDGTLGPWQRESSMHVRRQTLAAVVQNGYLYALGGSDLSTVEFAKINLNGSLGEWQYTTAMTKGRNYLSALAMHGYLFAIGGDMDGSGTVERAKFNNDGTLGEWEFVNQLQYDRNGHIAVPINNFIYVLGGSATPGQASSIERATISSDGTLGAWQVIGALPVTRYYASAVYTTDFVYLLGGYTNGTNYNSVIRLPIRADGTLGEATFLDSLHFERQGSGAVLENGRVYVVGGADYRNATTEESVEWATLADLAIPRDNHVSINDGDLFTNQISVTLSISGKTGVIDMQVSNDGGFANTVWEPCQGTKQWEITQFGNSIIPRTVYLRYRDTQGTVSNIVQDDIILDVTAPSGSVAIVPLANQRQNFVTSDIYGSHTQERTDSVAASRSIYLPLVSSQANCPQTGIPNVSLQLTAQDDVSGVSEMLISNSSTFTCATWQPFASTQAWFVPPGVATTVHVKFRDHAGNISVVAQDTITLPSQ